MNTALPNAAKPVATKTEYVILASNDKKPLAGITDGGGDNNVDVTSFGAPREWTIAASAIQASSAEQAVRIYAEKAKSELERGATGTFVAIPARSWKPITVTVETQTVVKIGEAS